MFLSQGAVADPHLHSLQLLPHGFLPWLGLCVSNIFFLLLPDGESSLWKMADHRFYYSLLKTFILVIYQSNSLFGWSNVETDVSLSLGSAFHKKIERLRLRNVGIWSLHQELEAVHLYLSLLFSLPIPLLPYVGGIFLPEAETRCLFSRTLMQINCAVSSCFLSKNS